MYAIIQSINVNNANKFDIIKGERAPAGYPVGYEGRDWFKTKFTNLTIEEARLILETLNKQ
jgi:hypothetical protein